MADYILAGVTLECEPSVSISKSKSIIVKPLLTGGATITDIGKTVLNIRISIPYLKAADVVTIKAAYDAGGTVSFTHGGEATVYAACYFLDGGFSYDEIPGSNFFSASVNLVYLLGVTIPGSTVGYSHALLSNLSYAASGHTGFAPNPHGSAYHTGINIDDLADVVIVTPADNEVLTWDAATSKWTNQVSSGGTDEKAKVSSNDTTSGYLYNKLVVGTGISKLEIDDGGNETLQFTNTDLGSTAISAHQGTYNHVNYNSAYILKTTLDALTGILVGTAGSYSAITNNSTNWNSAYTNSTKLKISADDTTPGYGEDKIIAGANITINVLNPGVNEQLEIVSSAGGAVAFTDLTDVPANYATHGEKFVKVKAAEDGLEFIPDPGYLTAVTPHDILSAIHPDSVAGSPVLGDVIIGNATPKWDKLAGNILAQQKFLSQTGDGTISALPSWQPIPTAGMLTFFSYKTISDIGGYYQMKTPASLGGLQTIINAGVVDTQILATFATNSGFPGITFMPSGIISVVTFATQTAGTKVTQIYAEIYKRDLAGAETLLATTGYSIPLTGVSVQYITQAVLTNSVVLLATDRIVTKKRIHVTGGGSVSDVTLSIEGISATRTELPSAIVDATNFVPYSGATLDTDLGVHNILAANLNISNWNDAYSLKTTIDAINGIVKCDGAGNISAATEGSDYLDSSRIDNTVYGASWDGVTDIAPSKNVVYDKIESIVSGSGSASWWTDQTPDNGTYGLLAGLVNGINTTFTVSQSKFTTGSMLVYRNGQVQTQGAGNDWVETDPATGTFDFVTAPLSGDIITVHYQYIVTLGSISWKIDSNPDNGTYGLLTVDVTRKICTTSTGKYLSGSLMVTVNGQLQTQGIANDFTETDPATGTFTLSIALGLTDVVMAYYESVASTSGNAHTVDGHHMDQDVLKASIPTFAGLGVGVNPPTMLSHFAGSTDGLMLLDWIGQRAWELGIEHDTINIQDLAFYIADYNAALRRFFITVDGFVYLPYVYNATVGGTNRDLYIDNTGKLGYDPSSIEYKENIKELKDSSWIYGLRPVEFDFKDKDMGVNQIGLIAEEVEKVNPKIISYKREEAPQEIKYDKKGIKISKNPKFVTTDKPETVNYSKLIVPLLVEIQNLRKRIEKLEQFDENGGHK